MFAPVSLPSTRPITCLLVGLMTLSLSAVGLADDDVIVSVKHVLKSGRRSIGGYTADEQIHVAFDAANRALAANDAGWRLVVDEIVDVSAMEEYFDVANYGDVQRLEAIAIRDPQRYAWRSDAINIYVVNNLFHPDPIGGVCSFPAPMQDITREIILIKNQGIAQDGVGWLHEVGHYMSLAHTFQTADFSENPDRVCTGVGACHDGGGRVETVMCPDNCPDATNVMSYNRFDNSQAAFSQCQLGQMRRELDGSRSHVVRGGGSQPQPEPQPRPQPDPRPEPRPGSETFLRGDVDGSGFVALNDAVNTLLHLFASGPAPLCLDAADADDNSAIELNDAVFTLLNLFANGRAFPAPAGDCGSDPTADNLGCEQYDFCSPSEPNPEPEPTPEPRPEPEPQTVGIVASADNVFIYDSFDPSMGERVFDTDVLLVGCDWGFSFFGPEVRCYYTALKFDVDGAVGGRRIRRAVLRLHASRTAADIATTYAVNALAGAWSPSTLRLSNAPGFFEDGESQAQPPRDTSAELEIDVTKIVENWTAGTWNNNGFVLRDATQIHPGFATSRAMFFESMDVATNADRRPQLVIEFE